MTQRYFHHSLVIVLLQESIQKLRGPCFVYVQNITPLIVQLSYITKFLALQKMNLQYLTIRPVARKGYGSIAHEAIRLMGY